MVRSSDLRKTFVAKGTTVEAARGVSLAVGGGEIVGFLGPNGAGKTTTLRMLTTLLPIDGGEAEVAGFDVRRDPAGVRRHIGYVSQRGGADAFATGRENLRLQARLYGHSGAEAVGRADRALAVLDLEAVADRPVRTYSGGQRRRLDVALGIVHTPQVLFLDEPTTGLDPQNRANLWDHVRRLRAAGTAIFLTTHYLEEADVLCDRVLIIDHGRIIAEGTPEDLKRQVAGDAIAVATADEGAAARALHCLEGAQWVREASADGPLVRLYVDDGGACLPRVLRLLDDAGIAVTSLRLWRPTLDDVFLRATGRSLRDSGEGAAAEAEAR
jgi:ABC-2 type transport system ATP-binding protein